ncbi:MAG: indoleacetamide hydrolase [Gammaproteobacteria bacterium]|nr:indoleacetamide hydrolase [Gammaproteobacteria bacterium]
MSSVADILDLTLAEALERMQAGEFSAVEYVQAMLERNREVAHLNAVVCLDEQSVLQAARQRDRQRRNNGNPELLGAPLLLKDNINTVKLPTSGCTPALKGHVPPADAPVARLLLDAGAVIFGKSNMHELAFGVTNNNPTFGPARNPYNPDLIPGGSSGGTAVAIGAGILPAGLGSDTGGSTRLPAAFCGISGFRPTIGRYPASGVIPISATRDTPGPMARAVEDLQLLDRVMAGDTAPAEPVSLAEVRLGVPRAYFYENLEPGLADVVEATLDLLAASCKALVEVDLDGVADLNDKVSFPVVLYEAKRDMIQYLADFAPGISIDDILAQIASPDVKEAYNAVVSDAVSKTVYEEAVHTCRPQLQALFSACFTDNRLDALVIPATPLTAPPIGRDSTVDLNGAQQPTMATIIRSTDPSSNAGLPSLCVAAGLAPNGLPVGVCLEGPVGTDRRLLAIGKALQDEIGFLPRPDLSRGQN